MSEIRNLLTDPWPSRLSWTIVGGGPAANVELRMNAALDGIYVRTIASPPAWIGLWVSGLTPGVEYVAAIYKDGSPVTLLAKDEVSGREAEQPALAPTGHGHTSIATTTDTRALTVASRWEVTA